MVLLCCRIKLNHNSIGFDYALHDMCRSVHWNWIFDDTFTAPSPSQVTTQRKTSSAYVLFEQKKSVHWNIQTHNNVIACDSTRTYWFHVIGNLSIFPVHAETKTLLWVSNWSRTMSTVYTFHSRKSHLSITVSRQKTVYAAQSSIKYRSRGKHSVRLIDHKYEFLSIISCKTRCEHTIYERVFQREQSHCDLFTTKTE